MKERALWFCCHDLYRCVFGQMGTLGLVSWHYISFRLWALSTPSPAAGHVHTHAHAHAHEHAHAHAHAHTHTCMHAQIHARTHTHTHTHTHAHTHTHTRTHAHTHTHTHTHTQHLMEHPSVLREIIARPARKFESLSRFKKDIPQCTNPPGP